MITGTISVCIHGPQIKFGVTVGSIFNSEHKTIVVLNLIQDP